MSYNIIAPFYDAVMDHVDYSDWYELLLRIVKKYRISIPLSVLEIGGGTGTLGNLIMSNEQIFDYFGSDECYNMALEAGKKNISFFCADGCSLPVKKQFDLIIFLYDGINYLQSIEEYKLLFDSVAECLKKDSLFLFDITTRENSFKYFFDIFDYQEIKGTSVIRHSYYQMKHNIQKNDFLFFSPVDPQKNIYTKNFESHSQNVYTPEQIKQAIPERLFSCIGVWDGFTMKPYTHASERIHFLLQKKSDD